MIRSLSGSILFMAVAFGSHASLAADTKEEKAKSPSHSQVTAQDQSNQTRDMELTRKIRKELMDTDLSIQGKNVTVVTDNGMVALRGTVPSEQEKSQIGEIATRMAPNVRNDIVVKQ